MLRGLQRNLLVHRPVSFFVATASARSLFSSTPVMSSNAPSDAPPPATSSQNAEGKPAGELSKSAARKQARMAQAAAQKAAKGASQAASQAPAGAPKTSERAAAKAAKKAQQAEAAKPFVNTTPEGEKKDMTQPMADGYDPAAVESAWYSWWEKQGYFKPQFAADGKSIKEEGYFYVPEPPPNVTGLLHTGHGMMLALEDVLTRWNRMLGKTTLFCPGYDHAGIATQSVVEKRLYKATGQTRHDLGREGLLSKIFEWKEEYQQRITGQTKRMGVSCDWDRVAFTMSPELSEAVSEAFVRLHEEGTIYRAKRLVNFCVFLNTTLSNIEVDNMEVTGRKLINVPGYGDERIEFGVITSFAYPIADSDEKIIVATTRPETMLGDTAIAVHPTDERYKHLHGKFAQHPFVDRKIPIICDDTVEKDFGTGAVKITPAHDFNDYARGKAHNLEFINILNDDGTLNEVCGEFQGVKRLSARRMVIEKLKSAGLYIEAKDNPMAIPICSRSGDIIEPILKPQWWVNCSDMAKEAIERTRAGEMRIRPQTSEDEWYRWLENIQDWCISRQLWWGHRCPVYYVNIEGSADRRDDAEFWVPGRTQEEAQSKAEKKFAGQKFTLEQDDDVLDTWFSSGLWPFSILGWPKQTEDLQRFYPASILETGWDIMFFWVARMVFFGIKFTGQMPFKEVFCHPIVRDAHGRKMSKSLGNVINPTDIIEGVSLEVLHEQLSQGNLDPKEMAKAKEGQRKDYPKGIPQCGADALRFTLCAYVSGGRDVNLEVGRVEGYRHFCNKLWNATKFALLKLQNGFVPNESDQLTGQESLVEKWILDRLNYAAGQINMYMEARNFMMATSTAYNFWLYELCDVYIEAMKPMTDEGASAESRKSAQNTLYTCLDQGLRLLSPFMPFVTEELWQRLPRRPNDSTASITISRFPTFSEARANATAVSQFDTVFAVVKASRSLAGKYNIQSNIQTFIQASDAAERASLTSQVPTIIALAKGTESSQVVASIKDVPSGCVSEVVSGSLVVNLLVKGKVDLAAEIDKCKKKQALADNGVQKLKGSMAAPDYSNKIPAHVQEKNIEKLQGLESEIAALQETIDKLSLI